jgi:mRNA interferase RelE/StbE
MKIYQIVIGKIASKELRKLPKGEVQRIFPKIKSLSSQPRPEGSKKLKSQSENLWRIRIGDYRVIYSIDDSVNIVDVRRVGHRRDIYLK